MQSIDPTGLPPRDMARLLNSMVAPRPIAWVSTLDANGVRNLAPFSYFNAVGSVPPLVMISISSRAGQPKDTLRNLLDLGEMVIHIADEALSQAMNLTSGEYDPSVDEIALAGVEAAPSVVVRPPRLAQAPIALEVKLIQQVPVPPTGYTLAIGQVVYVHLRDGLLRPNGLVDAQLLRPIARLGGSEYSTIGEVFEMERPT